MSRRYWYFYSGGDDSLATNYTRLPFNPNDCQTGQTVCAIYGLPNGVNPDIPQAAQLTSGTIRDYITSAQLISNAYPVSPQKSYVYLKLP